MVKITFKCDNCNKRFFFKEFEEVRNPHKHDKSKKYLKYCIACDVYLRVKESERKYNLEKSRKQKLSKKNELKDEADKELLKELDQEKKNKQIKEEKDKIKKRKELHSHKKLFLQEGNNFRNSKENNDKKIEVKENLEKKAEEYSKTLNKVIYVYADVKRIKVLEWINSKKRIALNKEREIRKTHAGGFSQEKFQKFVMGKKRKADEWILENLSRKGILRGPYDKVVIESPDKELNEFLEQLLL